jgi:hypothetical protein
MAQMDKDVVISVLMQKLATAIDGLRIVAEDAVFPKEVAKSSLGFIDATGRHHFEKALGRSVVGENISDLVTEVLRNREMA